MIGRLVFCTRKGTNEVSTNEVAANVMFLLTEGPFGVLPLTYAYLHKSARAYLFPQSVKLITFAAAPLVVTPFVRNQLLHTLIYVVCVRGSHAWCHLRPLPFGGW